MECRNMSSTLISPNISTSSSSEGGGDVVVLCSRLWSGSTKVSAGLAASSARLCVLFAIYSTILEPEGLVERAWIDADGWGINGHSNIHCSHVISSLNMPVFTVIVRHISALARLIHRYEIVPIYRGESVHRIMPVVQSGTPLCGFIWTASLGVI